MDKDREYTEFAEIEISASPNRTTPTQTALRFFSAVTQPQSIEQKAVDPIRQKFFSMRSLASDKPFARDDSELFYRQAKFMEDQVDSYEGNAKFFMYFPYYQHMGYEQLRTYFTWRTRARKGDFQPISVSYVFLYIYELLSGIGVSDPADGLKKLVGIWNATEIHDPTLEEYLPRWFRDYHIYYELPHSFTDFIKENDLQERYSLRLIIDAEKENSLLLWNSISSYDVTKSKFYKNGNDQLLQSCFEAVLRSIDDFCFSHDAIAQDLLIYRVSNKTPWYPFRQALFSNWLSQPDREVRMPGQERYYCTNNRWTASVPIYYSTQRDFAGYIVKKTESCLRQAVNYKHKLTVELKPSYRAFRELKEIDADFEEFDRSIEKSVADFHRDLTRTVVTVDHKNLARIRKEALGTQDKLIVPENEEKTDVIPLRDITDKDDASVTELKNPESSGWAELKNSLTETELKALSIALNDNHGVKAFADENGIMLEVLADGINEKAADYIGDNILETDDGMTIYDDYREEIAEMVG